MRLDSVPLNRLAVDQVLANVGLDSMDSAIRKVVAAVSAVEKELSVRFLRMEFGIPGFEPHPLGPEAEIAALRLPRVASQYAPITGHPPLKEEGSKFLKAFLDVEIAPECVIPVTGSMQGGLVSQALAGRAREGRNRIAFLAPCFSVHRTQCRFLGLEEVLIDLYDRATWLDRLEDVCKTGKVGGVIYSTPNNPTWTILSEIELKRLGEICTTYDVIAIEDVAYFGMDFRHDYSVPGTPPYPPTVARYTDNFIFLFSASKVFNYAGQRIGLAFISPRLAERDYPSFEPWFGTKRFLDAFVMSGCYCTSSGSSHSAQYALTSLLAKSRRGEFNFLKPLRAYAERAKEMKKILLEKGFHLVYGEDLGEPLSDGFFFTFAFHGMSGSELAKELLYYGISTTTLKITGSERSEAVRACVSQIDKSDFPLFEERLQAFQRDHKTET